MNSLITLCIFIIILFLYIHIANQYKKTDELEIYETDFTDKKHLDDVCELKQPVLIDMKDILPDLFSNISPETVAQFSHHDINIKDTNDYYNSKDPRSVDSIFLPFSNCIQFMEKDKQSHLFSENNQDFLDESGLIKYYEQCNNVLKPSFTIHAKYDLMFGSCNTWTPLKYHTSNRQFLCVTHGKIKIKMTPWKSSKFIHPYKDYENYEFCSSINPKTPQSTYNSDYEKINFIEFDVLRGNMLYIPPYWWFSIIYLDDPTTFISSITYSTAINCVSNSWDIILYLLQQQNITKKIKRSSEFKIPIVEKHDNNEIDPIVKEIEITSTATQETNEVVITENEDENDEEIEEDKNEQKIPTKKIDVLLEKENIDYTISDI